MSTANFTIYKHLAYPCRYILFNEKECFYLVNGQLTKSNDYVGKDGTIANIKWANGNEIIWQELSEEEAEQTMMEYL